MSNMTAAEAIAKLTPRGKIFMTRVGLQDFDYFDDGIVEHSGNWGENMAAQLSGYTDISVRSSAGVMVGTKKLGLWYTGDHGPDGTWWSLTELGAEVANELAAQARAEETPAEETPEYTPGVGIKRGKKWTYIYAADGSLVAEVRNDQFEAVAAVLASGQA